MQSLEENFKTACENAQAQSQSHDCTIHVNAVLSTFPFPTISHFVVSDWHDGTTVKTYSFGREH